MYRVIAFSQSLNSSIFGVYHKFMYNIISVSVPEIFINVFIYDI